MTGLDAVLIGGAILPLGLWGLYHWGIASTASLLLAFQVGLNFPHYFQTYSLTYLNPAVRRREGLRLLATVAIAFIVPIGAILWSPAALKWTLAFISLWAFWHITQQTRGLAGLYLRRGGDGSPGLRRPLLAFLFLSTAAVVAGRIAGYGLTLSRDPLVSFRLPTLLFSALATVALGGTLLRLKRPQLPAALIAVLHTAALALSMSVDNLSLALALATSWHALQYLGLTFSVQRGLDEPRALPRLARTEVVAFFGIAVGFGLVAAGAAAALPSPWGQAIYLPLLMVHYLSDGWLWRPERNPDVRAWLRPLASAA